MGPIFHCSFQLLSAVLQAQTCQQQLSYSSQRGANHQPVTFYNNIQQDQNSRTSIASITEVWCTTRQIKGKRHLGTSNNLRVILPTCNSPTVHLRTNHCQQENLEELAQSEVFVTFLQVHLYNSEQRKPDQIKNKLVLPRLWFS